MRTVRFRISDSLHDRQLAVLKQFVQRRERRMKTDRVVELQHLLGRDAERRPIFVVQVVGKRDQRVKPVIASAKFHDDQHMIVGRIVRRGRRSREQSRHRSGQGDERQTTRT